MNQTKDLKRIEKMAIALMKFALLILLICAYGVDVFAKDFMPEYTRYSLKNGLDVILAENHQTPLVDMRLVIKSGPACDQPDRAGLAAVTGDVLIEGSENFPDELLMAAVDSVGGRLYFNASREALYYYGNFLSRDIELALKMLADALMRPQLTQESLERIKNKAYSVVMQESSVAQIRIRDILYSSIYGEVGFGIPAFGTATGIQSITLSDIKEYYHKNIQAGNAILIMAGDFDKGHVKKLIKKYMSDWAKGGEYSEPIYNAAVPDSMRIIVFDDSYAVSAEFVMGIPASKIDSTDGVPLIMLNYILGSGRDVSRLSRRLINEQFVATTVGSTIDWSRGDGMMMVSGAATNEMVSEAVRQVLEVIRELREIKISAKELEECKAYFRSMTPMLFENASVTVEQFNWQAVLGTDLDFYNHFLKQMDNVTPEEIRQVAKKYLNSDHLTIVVNAPARIVKNDFSDLAPTEIIESSRE